MTKVGIMSIKQYALLGVVTLALGAVIVYTNTPVDADTVSAKPAEVPPLVYQLEKLKADNQSAESKLKQEEERLKKLEEERIELEGQLR